MAQALVESAIANNKIMGKKQQQKESSDDEAEQQRRPIVSRLSQPLSTPLCFPPPTSPFLHNSPPHPPLTHTFLLPLPPSLSLPLSRSLLQVLLPLLRKGQGSDPLRAGRAGRRGNHRLGARRAPGRRRDPGGAGEDHRRDDGAAGVRRRQVPGRRGRHGAGGQGRDAGEAREGGRGGRLEKGGGEGEGKNVSPGI